MFGLNNSAFKKWKLEPLSANTEIVSGVTKGKKYGYSILRAVPYMRVANVQDGHLNLSEIKTIEVTEFEIRRYKLNKGDLLLTEGGDPDKLGRGAVWNDEINECIHQNHIFRVRVKDTSINPVFLSALMASKYGKSYFLKAAKQTTGIASINSTQLKAFPLIKPPVALQDQFASIVTKVESLKSKYTQSLTELETLYSSLSQRAFKDELDLTRVSVDMVIVPESLQTSKGIPSSKVVVTHKFSNGNILSLIKSKLNPIFLFEELWAELVKTKYTDLPSKKGLQDSFIRDYLESDPPIILQIFDVPTSIFQIDENRIAIKQIAFKVNNEN
jgi:type I restriction enzyme S subunit